MDGCVLLVLGDDVDADLVFALGGPAARRVLDGDSRVDDRYWLRVWGARGLLWAWEDHAFDAVVTATRDPAWRVREMAAKVAARHLLGDALPAVTDLLADPVPRVRTTAERAVARITAAGA